jgi:hypothetical protein
MTVFTPNTLRRALAQTGFGRIVRGYTSGSYLVLLHSLRFAMDDGMASPQRAAAIHRLLLHPFARALAWLPFKLADRIAGGSTLEVLATADAE